MRAFFRRVNYLFRRERIERELQEELAFHRAQLDASTSADSGVRRAMGNTTLAQEDARAVWIWPWLQSVQQDVTYAGRIVRRNPAFGAAVVLVMALGIGTTTAVFTLLDALVLRSLPVERPSRLVYFDNPSFSYPIFQEVRARSGDIFSGVFAWNLETLNVQWSTELESLEVLTASGEFYSTLGVNAIVGRTFNAADDRIGGGPDGRVTVISHAAWQRRFGGDPQIIGRTILIERDPFTIVGITPPSFFGVAPGLAPEITIPVTTLKSVESLQSPSSAWLHLMGRVRDGVSINQAASAVQAFWPHVLESTFNRSMPADRKAIYLSRTTSLQSARAGYSRVRNQFEGPLWVLLALAVQLLVVACASTTNLLLARGSARAREIAIRAAIGASRFRIARQMLTEAMVWTLIGSAAGLLLASWGTHLLVMMMTTRDEPIAFERAVNIRIVAFTIGLSILTAIVCSLVPALRATRPAHQRTLHVGRDMGAGTLRRWSIASVLVALQVALTVVLLTGAGLFIRSLATVLSQDAGLDRDRVVVLGTDPMAAGYREARLQAYYNDLLRRLENVPGVESASLSWHPPISDDRGNWTQSIGIDGAPVPTNLTRTVYFNAVSPGYFRTVGMRLLRGRDFTNADDATASKVVVINDSLARGFFGDADAIGRRITVGRNKSRRDLEIIGTVSDAKYQRLQETPRAIAYLPYKQLSEFVEGENLFAEVRTATSERSIRESVAGQARGADPRVPLIVETVADRIRTSLVKERVLATLAGGLGVSALLLACASLYGLLSYSVSRQTPEIGLRLVLGASRMEVVGVVVRQAAVLAVAGAIVGLGLSLAVGRLARSLLFQITPTDPIAIAGAIVVTTLVAASATLVPACRAAFVDPVVALRHE
jgi:predicted permease